MKSIKKTKRAAKRNGVPAKRVQAQDVTVIGPLKASALRDVLWETLNDVRTNQMQANRADAVATQAREILRTIKTQLNVASAAKRGVPADIIKFAES
jgi:hypothetical protein